MKTGVLFLLFVSTLTASAQWNPGYTVDSTSFFNNQQMSTAVLDAQRRTMARVFQDGQRARSAPSSTHAPVPLSQNGPVSTNNMIADNPAISADVRRIFIGSLAQGNPASAAQVDHLLGNVRVTFAHAVQPYGLRADNMVDVTTAYLVVMWMTANRQTSLPQPAAVQGVRRQLAALPDFSQSQRITSTVQQQQRDAEILMYKTCMGILVRENTQTRPDLWAKASDIAEQQVSQMGFDLRRYTLTPSNGFITQ